MPRKPRVLVIDDEDAVRETICENLAESGFTVLQAANGREGLALIEAQGPPQVVVTDLVMPGMEGLETIAHIRRANKDVKLVAISGGGQNKNTDYLSLAARLGADAVLPKPFDMGELERIIRGLIS